MEEFNKQEALMEICTDWEYPDQYEGGKCPTLEILGRDCDSNDNHCLVKKNIV